MPQGAIDPPQLIVGLHDVPIQMKLAPAVVKRKQLSAKTQKEPEESRPVIEPSVEPKPQPTSKPKRVAAVKPDKAAKPSPKPSRVPTPNKPSPPYPSEEAQSPQKATAREYSSTLPRKPKMVARADYLRNPPPIYPDTARRRSLEGRTLLRVLIDSEGEVVSVRLEESSGHRVLDDEALRTVRRWRFTPASEGGKAIEAEVLVPIKFTLREK